MQVKIQKYLTRLRTTKMLLDLLDTPYSSYNFVSGQSVFVRTENKAVKDRLFLKTVMKRYCNSKVKVK